MPVIPFPFAPARLLLTQKSSGTIQRGAKTTYGRINRIRTHKTRTTPFSVIVRSSHNFPAPIFFLFLLLLLLFS